MEYLFLLYFMLHETAFVITKLQWRAWCLENFATPGPIFLWLTCCAAKWSQALGCLLPCRWNKLCFPRGHQHRGVLRLCEASLQKTVLTHSSLEQHKTTYKPFCSSQWADTSRALGTTSLRATSKLPANIGKITDIGEGTASFTWAW